MKQMSLIEMDGFLKGKCIPRDLKVNETNAEYLVRKFAEAEAKCAALAAELSAIEEIHNDAVFITDAHYDQCHPEVQKIIGALAVLQIPAYQDFLAEVRAQGVEMYADNLDNVAGDAERGGFDYAVKFLHSEASSVRLFADQLRKGGNQ
ncbi:hypothetical protein [Escherichia coli]|uniref:Uncharacterized protein n=1 Tax=Escherichia phage HK542 TaxID=432200 RepID=K7P7C5_9CAUD|nr:hypothetical protein [Escherichia coli]YP_007151761.1 hypothetical protein F864_gp26 [Escherichia phage HK542]AFH20407.1 hypothetical protein HK542_026 [Escherichia phage HK542]